MKWKIIKNIFQFIRSETYQMNKNKKWTLILKKRTDEKVLQVSLCYPDGGCFNGT